MTCSSSDLNDRLIRLSIEVERLTKRVVQLERKRAPGSRPYGGDVG